MRLPDPCICLVTDRRQTAPSARTAAGQLRALEALLDEAIDAGVDLIQIRERDLDARRLAGVVARTVRRAERRPTQVVVNDRADVAVVAAAGGVHLREGGPPIARLRTMLPPGALVGRSIHDPAAASADPAADYVLLGPIYESRSKPAGWSQLGPDALRRAAGAPMPVVAIGGMTVDRARACLDAGAGGVAAIGLFLPPSARADGLGPRGAVSALRSAWSGRHG